jgi:hypothetical protein
MQLFPLQEYMTFCNAFVDKNQDRFFSYLKRVIVDPLQTGMWRALSLELS